MIFSIKNSQITEYKIEFKNLNLNSKQILPLLGYIDGNAPEHIKNIVEEVFVIAPEKCEIKGGYRLFDKIEISDNLEKILILNKQLTTKKIITTQLRGAGKIAVFACTAGAGLETWAKELLKGEDPARGYIIDTIASIVVESAMDLIHDNLEKQMNKEGLKITNRFSPGYCGWPLKDNILLFSLLPDNFCNISLNDSAFMTPVKSISGFIGIGENVKRAEYQCNFCDKEDCVYRNKYKS